MRKGSFVDVIGKRFVSRKMQHRGSLNSAHFSKMAQCLVLTGCEQAARFQVLKECTREGYCKDGYCEYRRGDVTPRLAENRGVLKDMITEVYEQPCVGSCCEGGDNNCKNTARVLDLQRQRSRNYRHKEKNLPPRRYRRI